MHRISRRTIERLGWRVLWEHAGAGHCVNLYIAGSYMDILAVRYSVPERDMADNRFAFKLEREMLIEAWGRFSSPS
jgi:hypothetical protein